MPAIVQEVLSSPGQPLDAGTRAFMEPRFGHNFSQVRVHTDSRAEASAQAINAQAYTLGPDMVFGPGRYAPGVAAGRRLLAHELTHVVQQTGAPSGVPLIALAETNDGCEREARQAEQTILSGSPDYSVQGHVPPRVQRDVLHRTDDPMHQPVIDQFRREHGLPLSGLDEFGNPEGPDAAEIKYGLPAKARVLAHELQTLIDGATWKEIRKRVYPKESAAGVKRAKDRHAGALPDLTGLGRLKTLEHFATSVRGLQGRWPALRPDDRVQELGKAANTELAGADVPGFLKVDKEPMEFKGFFSRRFWKFVISQELVTNNTLGNDDAAEVSNTTLHEGRHAEQQFLAARFSAGVNKRDASAIVVEQGIPKVIADQAVAKKFDARTDAETTALGRKMFQATVTDRASNQAISDDDGIKDLAKKRAAAQTALEDVTRVATAKTVAEATAKRNDLRAQITLVEQKYTLYRNIPYEADAHEVGDAAEQAFKKWP